MKRKASFSIEKSTSHTSAHNSREDKPKYLLEVDPNFNGNYYEEIFTREQFTELAQERYKKVVGQKMQKKQIEADNFIQEAVINLEEQHNIEDVNKLFADLKEEYGGHTILSIAIHSDEGHFVDKDGIEYYPTKHIIYDENDKSWYRVPLKRFLDDDFNAGKPKREEFNEKVDISTFKKVHNKHAHVEFSMFDPMVGKASRMAPKDFQSRHKIVAESLDLRYEPSPNRYKKTAISEHKQNKSNVRNAKVAQKIELEKTFEYDYKKLQKTITSLENASTEQKKELHRLNSKVKNKKATAKELQDEITKLTDVNKTVVTQYNDLLAKSKEDASMSLEYLKAIKSKDAAIDELKIEKRMTEQDNDLLIEKLNREEAKAETEEKLNRELLESLNSVKVELEAPKQVKTTNGLFQYIKTKFNEMKEKIKELFTENEILKEDNIALKRTETTLKSKINDLEGKLSTEQEKVARAYLTSEYFKSNLYDIDKDIKLARARHGVGKSTEDEYKAELRAIKERYEIPDKVKPSHITDAVKNNEITVEDLKELNKMFNNQEKETYQGMSR